MGYGRGIRNVGTDSDGLAAGGGDGFYGGFVVGGVAGQENDGVGECKFKRDGLTWREEELLDWCVKGREGRRDGRTCAGADTGDDAEEIVGCG